MEQRSTGIVLRTRLLTESSLIVHWLTRDFGRLATVAKGARRAKSPFQGKLDLFYVADLSFQPSRRSELHALREVSVRDYHRALRVDLQCLAQASYFAQLLELVTEANTPLPGLFELLTDALTALSQAPPQPITVHAFEMKLLVELGLNPTLARAGLTAGAHELLTKAADADWNFVSRMRLSPAQASELAEFLGRFILDQFGRVPKARALAVSPK